MNVMRVIVVGLGVQGKKRQRIAGEMCIATVDPAVSEADYCDVRDVPLSDFDAALLCVPDANKYELVKYLVGNHVFSPVSPFPEFPSSSSTRTTMTK